MENTTTNIYYMKALTAYPYELDTAVESLGYALSYDATYIPALCLMARIQAEEIRDFHAAKELYAEALAQDMEHSEIYPDYIRTLLWADDLDEAQKLLDLAFLIKATDRGQLYMLQGQLFEIRGTYKKAIKAFEKAKIHGYNNRFMTHIDNEISRIRKKVSLIKPKKSSKKKEAKGKKSRKGKKK